MPRRRMLSCGGVRDFGARDVVRYGGVNAPAEAEGSESGAHRAIGEKFRDRSVHDVRRRPQTMLRRSRASVA